MVEKAPLDAQPASAKAPSKEEELTYTLQRVQADFENYHKRAQQEMNQNYMRGKAAAFKEMLPILDTLDSAIAKEKNESKKALESLRTHMLHVLKQNGVKQIETHGKQFDPFTSECLLQGNDPTQEEDSVLEEIQKGYMFHEDVLRHAKVKVNKLVDDNQNNQGGN